MPPQRTIIVDRQRMLQTIATLSDEQQEATRARTTHWPESLAAREIEAESWVRRNVGQFACKPLTPSEAKRHQQALVAMGAEGLIDLTPSHVRVTDAGRAKLEASHAR